MMLSPQSVRSKAQLVGALVLLLLGWSPAKAVGFGAPAVDGQITAPRGSERRCTIVYAADDDIALAGNNEDWTGLFSQIQFLPGVEGKFGRVLFGFDAIRTPDGGRELLNPQGGMNEQGLFFDGASAEDIAVPGDSPKAPHDHEVCSFVKALEECSTVDEVLELFERNDCSGYHSGQFLIGDRFGNSAIVEPLTVIPRTGRYQVVTNFLQSRTPPEEARDPRYRLAAKLLEESNDYSVDLLRRVLSAVHWEEYSGSMTVTLYSYVCDLKRAEIYVYNFHDFEKVAKINLRDELAKGESLRPVASLFPYETFAEKRYKAWRIVGLLYERAVENGLEGPEGMIAYCRDLSSGEDESARYEVHETQLLAAGYRLLEDGKSGLAIEVMKFCVAEHPESAQSYDCLGDVYAAAGEKELAIQTYEKSLELHPDNDNARQRLDELRR